MMESCCFGPRRKKERIPIVLDQIRIQWEKYPDLRLGQLLLSSCRDEQQLFYIEDEQLVEIIKCLFEED